MVDFSTFSDNFRSAQGRNIYPLCAKAIPSFLPRDLVFTFKDNCFQANSKFSISTVLLTNLASESNFRHVELRIGLTSHCELLIVSLCFEERNWVALEMTGMIIVVNGTCRVVALVDVSFFRV